MNRSRGDVPSQGRTYSEIEPNYNPAAAFAPWDMGQPVNTYRSSNGLPGPAYWQNRQLIGENCIRMAALSFP
jgi:hypothetical protein